MSVKVLREANESIPAEVLEFADKIDFNGLNKILSDRLGTVVKLVPGKIEKGYSGYYYNAEMNKDLSDKCGIMSEVFSSVKIDLFNSAINTDKDSGVMFFWCTPHFSYQMKEGGSNGLKICTATFTVEDGWNIRWYE